MDALPESLLNAIAWDFSQPLPSGLPWLESAAAMLQLQAFGSLEHWHPWAREVGAKVVQVQLGEGRGEPRVLELRSVCPEGFTTLELLAALHEAVRPVVAGMGRVCLRSLSLQSRGWGTQPPRYLLRLATVLERPAACGCLSGAAAR